MISDSRVAYNTQCKFAGLKQGCMVWKQGPAGLVEMEQGVWGPSAVTKSYYMKNPWKRKQEWASYCDLEFPKPCLRLERQFQAPEKCFFRWVLNPLGSVAQHFPATLQER